MPLWKGLAFSDACGPQNVSRFGVVVVMIRALRDFETEAVRLFFPHHTRLGIGALF